MKGPEKRIFNSGRKKILAHFFLKQCLIQGDVPSSPRQPFGSSLKTVELFKKTKNLFHLVSFQNFNVTLHNLPHPDFARPLSPVFNTHLQKVEFPLMNAYSICFNNHFMCLELVVHFCQQPKDTWDIFPDFQGMELCS